MLSTALAGSHRYHVPVYTIVAYPDEEKEHGIRKLRAVCADFELFLVILADACVIMRSNRFHQCVLCHVSSGLVDGHKPMLLHQTLLDTVYIKTCTRNDTQKCRSPSRVSRRSCILYPLRARCTDNVRIRIKHGIRRYTNPSSSWKAWNSYKRTYSPVRGIAHRQTHTRSDITLALPMSEHASLARGWSRLHTRQGCTLGWRLD